MSDYRPKDNRHNLFKRYRRNFEIDAPKIRLIDENGKQVGVVPVREGLTLAQNKGLDLIEIAREVQPPVCKIISFDKFKYEQQQKLKAAKKKQKEVEIKEFRLRLNIFDNDLQTRLKRMEEFLRKGDKIKITILFRGRENTKKDLGYDLLKQVFNYFGDKIQIEKEPIKQGNLMICVFGPSKKI